MKIKTIFRVIGIFFAIAGFYGGKADQFPFVLRLVKSEYVNIEKGIKVLVEKKALVPEDIGFKEITNLLRGKLEPQELAKQAIFEKIQLGNRGFRVDEVEGKSFAEIEIYIRNSPVLKYDIKILEKEIQMDLYRQILDMSVILFWLGIVINSVLIIPWKTKKQLKVAEE